MKTRPKPLRVRVKDWIPNFAIIGNSRIRNGQGRHSLEGPGRGLNPYPGTPTITGLLVVGRPPVKGLLGLTIIYNRPPSRPHQVTFYDMQDGGGGGEGGVYYYPFKTSVQKQGKLFPLLGAADRWRTWTY